MDGAPWPGALAVSGGGDSLALMLLLAGWAKAEAKPPPVVLTVDHGLSPGSATVARDVVHAAREAGLAAHILPWNGPKPSADIEAAARQARYRLMAGWCETHGVAGLYVGHTREDQAETFLLRLARGSGLDGLAAMQRLAPCPVPGFETVEIVRPLLDLGRAELRVFLEERGLAWAEDPMNDDPRFARVRLRRLWPALEQAGLGPSRIADAARHLARAREALELANGEFLAAHTHFEGNRALVDGAALSGLPRELGLRALAAILGKVSGAPYRPRFERLERLYEAILAGNVDNGRTLSGCRIGRAPKREALFGRSTLVVRPEPRTLDDAELPQRGG